MEVTRTYLEMRAPSLLRPAHNDDVLIKIENLTDGLSLFLVGLFKKVAIANYLAMYVDRVYDNPAAFGATRLALASTQSLSNPTSWYLNRTFSGTSKLKAV